MCMMARVDKICEGGHLEDYADSQDDDTKKEPGYSITHDWGLSLVDAESLDPQRTFWENYMDRKYGGTDSSESSGQQPGPQVQPQQRFNMSVVIKKALVISHKIQSPMYLRILIEQARMRVINELCKSSELRLIASESYRFDDEEAIINFLQKHVRLPDGTQISRTAAQLLGPIGNKDYSSEQMGEGAATLLPMATEKAINDAITVEMSQDQFERYYWLTKKDPAENVQGLKDLYFLVYKRKHRTQFDLPRIKYEP